MDDSSLPSEQKRARHMQGKRTKKRSCDKFLSTGSCKFGDRCKFSHDVNEASKQADGSEQKDDSAVLDNDNEHDDGE